MAKVTPIASVRTILDAANTAAASAGVVALLNDGFTLTGTGGISTIAAGANLFTQGEGSSIFTTGDSAAINTEGASSPILTTGSSSPIYTIGEESDISTNGINSNIKTRGSFILNNGTYFTTITHAPTASRNVSLGDYAGTLAFAPIVTPATPTTGGTISPTRYVDETHYVTPAGTLANLTWNLPLAADSRVGQVKVFLSTQTITALTVTVLGSGTKAGAALTAAVANEAYSYQCVSTSGNGTWLRIS